MVLACAPLPSPQGCVLLFSHCWPQGAAEAHSHPLWQLAERLGAEVATQYDPSRITHVVSDQPVGLEEEDLSSCEPIQYVTWHEHKCCMSSHSHPWNRSDLHCVWPHTQASRQEAPRLHHGNWSVGFVHMLSCIDTGGLPAGRGRPRDCKGAPGPEGWEACGGT
jgi:hypothetical protein